MSAHILITYLIIAVITKMLENICRYQSYLIRVSLDFTGGPVVKNLPASLQDTDLIPDLEGSMCHEATKPCAMTEPTSRAHKPRPLKPVCPRACTQQEKPPQLEAYVPQ